MMLLAGKLAVLTFSVLILLGTNINYTVDHLYMGQKKEFSTRLLNKLYLHMGVWAQVGSIINILLIIKGLELMYIPYLETIRHFQIPAIIFSFLKISIAHNIKKYNDELYLDLGYRISNWHLLSSFVSLR